MSIVTLKNEELTVQISSLGAEIQSIRDQNDIERLWQGDPAIWSGRAPILFPVAGGFKDDGYELDGQWYGMPKHGFARKEEWAVESAGEDEAVFLLTAQKPGFPFRYEFRAVFSLEANQLEVNYVVKNLDDRTFYFSVGAHEAYACPGKIEDYYLVFDEKENLDCYPLDGNQIKHETIDMGRDTDTLALSYSLLDHDALVFRNLNSTGVALCCRNNERKVHVEFEGNPTIMFWHHPDGQYLCIEPWNNGPDFVDAPHDIAKKPNFICLKPGREANRSHTITIL